MVGSMTRNVFTPVISDVGNSLRTLLQLSQAKLVEVVEQGAAIEGVTLEVRSASHSKLEQQWDDLEQATLTAFSEHGKLMVTDWQ